MQERNEPKTKKRALANVIFGGKGRKEGNEKQPSIAQKNLRRWVSQKWMSGGRALIVWIFTVVWTVAKSGAGNGG